MPIQHGERRLIDGYLSSAALFYSNQSGLGPGSFPHNPNGSDNSIAALYNFDGQVMGMMVHPEAYLFEQNHPYWTVHKWQNKKSDSFGHSF